MDEANYQIDPNFEPQGRPRSCTWPLNRPNVEDETNNDKTTSLKIEPTIEETDELTEEEAMAADQQPLMCQMGQPGSYLNAMKQDDTIYSFGTPPTTSVSFQPPAVIDNQNNLPSEFSGIVLTTNNVIQEQPNSYIDKPMVSLPAPTYQKSMVNSIETTNIIHHQEEPKQLEGFKPKPLMTTVQNKVCGSNSNPTGSGLTPTPKPKPSSRKNAWGNMSYADLITQAIESSPDKRLTLAQIYDWMVKNVNYFKDKGDSNSSAGWKNSIRHNLSLHAKFKRTQNEGTGKSSWWTINYEAKPGKQHRRPRAHSMDNQSNSKMKKSRNETKKKIDQKKQLAKNNGSLKQESSDWNGLSPRQDDLPEFSRFSTEYRQRTSSNASSIGPMSPPGPRSGSFVIKQDFDDEGGLMGLGNSSNGNMQCSDGGMLFSLVNEIKNDDGNDVPSTSRGNGGFASSYEASSPFDLSAELEQTPNLARLLQNNTISSKSPTSTKSSALPIRSKVVKSSLESSRPRSRANTMPRLQPQPKYEINSESTSKLSALDGSSARNQQSSSRCHSDIPSPMSYINNQQMQHQHQQQQQQDRQPNNILYSLLNTTQQSNNGPSSMQEPIFTSQQQQRHHVSKPTNSLPYNFPQQYEIQNDDHNFTSRAPLPSIQFTDKTMINQDPNLNSHTQQQQLTEMECQQQQQTPHVIDDMPFSDDINNLNLFDSSFVAEISDQDMSLLIGDIKGGIEPSALDKYFNAPTPSMNEGMEMDAGDKNQPTTTVYQSMSSASQQQQQQQQQQQMQQQLQQQQNLQQQLQLQQMQQQQQQQHPFHLQQNNEYNNFNEQPPQYQQLQSQQQQLQQQQVLQQQQQRQQQQRNDQYIFMTSPSSNNDQQQQMMSQHIGMSSYDDPALSGAVGFGISSSVESPNGHYNFQSPQQCYQQVVPQQQHLMMSGQATPISSATNYKT